MIRVILVDDHQMVRLGLSSYFSVQKDMEVVGEADNGEGGVELALREKPDIILMDLVMDGMDGIEATKAILAKWPDAKIIIVTSFIDDEKVFPAMESGASGYLLKTSSAAEIANAIRSIHKGENVFEEKVTQKVIDRETAQPVSHLHDDLTSRELEILTYIAEGYSNQEIADACYITLKTVKTHVSNILSKLDVSDRTHAAIYAFKNELVE